MAKNNRKEFETCSEHKMETKVWGNDWDRGICMQCIKHRVDLLWDLKTRDRDKE